jgi:hypothetical protein
MIEINNKIELRYSIDWIHKGFSVFRAKPLHFIVLSLLKLLLSQLPIIGSFFSILFSAQFARNVHKLEQSQEFNFSQLLAGLYSNHKVTLLALINMLLSTVVILLQGLLLPNITTLINNSNLPNITTLINNSNTLIMLFVIIIISIILQLAMWFAPLICLYNNVSCWQAMRLSLTGLAIHNTATFIVFGVLVMFFTIIAIIPIFLGLFIWIPTMNIMNYFIYKQVFIVKE